MQCWVHILWLMIACALPTCALWRSSDLGQPSCIYVVDGSQNECVVCAAFTMWFLSARDAKFKHLYHHQPATAHAYIQPPWLYKEIEELRRKSSVFNSTLGEDFVLELFDKWGGIPRAVLNEPAANIRSLHAGNIPSAPASSAALHPHRDWGDLLAAVNGSNVSAVMEWARQLSNVGKGVADVVSYKVLHLHPNPKAAGGVDYQHAKICFASTWVADQCVQHYLRCQRAELHALLVAGRDDPALATTCGHLLQGIFHNLIRESPARQFHRQLLRHADGSSPAAGEAALELISFPISAAALDAATNERSELVFAANPQLAGAADSILLRAEQSNYPSIESLIQLPAAAGPPAVTSSFFQVTASMHHPLKVEHLKPVVDNTRPGRLQPYHVYFCVPEHNFDAFAAQPYHIAGYVGDVLPSNAAGSIWPRVRGAPLQLLQYKLSIPIASELLPSSSSVKVASKLTGRGAKGRRRNDDEEEEGGGSGGGAAAGAQKGAVAAAAAAAGSATAGRSLRSRTGNKA
jgi:hypothetical protein